MTPLAVSLLSISHCPSLATRNLRTYCESFDDVRGHVQWHLLDIDIHASSKSVRHSAQRLSFSTYADYVLADLERSRPDIVGVSAYLWNVELSLRLAAQIRAVLPDVVIVFGGPDPGPRAAALLAAHPAVDAVIDGDGEEPMLSLVREALAGRPRHFDAVPQCWFRDGDRIRVSSEPGRPTDLGRLTLTSDDLEAAAAIAAWPHPFWLCETMRGCPYPCAFCLYGKTPAARKSTELVIDELAALLGRGIDVEIIDPTFTTYQKRAKDILRGRADRGVRGRVWFEAYADSIDEEMVELMVCANVWGVELGLQTISRAGLKAAARPQNLEKFDRAVERLRNAGIKFWVDVLFGLPETTADDYVATMDYAFELRAPIDTYRLLGLPGSPMMADAAEHQLVFADGPPYELLSSRTFTIDDVVFCSQFAATYDAMRHRLGDDLLWRITRLTGGLSGLIQRVFEAARAASPAAPARALRSFAPETSPIIEHVVRAVMQAGG